MARSRNQLHQLLKEIVQPVYFQSPPNTGMTFPCIVYSRDDEEVVFADNIPYNRAKRYQVTVIDRDPDSPLPDKVAELPLCSYDRNFVVDDLNHDVFTLFF